MVDAHMDELGGVIRRVTPRGLLTMQMLGGWLDQALVDQRWIIVGAKGPVRAVTGIRDVHVVPPDERTRCWIDAIAAARRCAAPGAVSATPSTSRSTVLR